MTQTPIEWPDPVDDPDTEPEHDPIEPTPEDERG